MELELITREPQSATCATPILFVHGAWQAAWCWDEHFLPYFAAHGFSVHALSLRNHGRSASAGPLRWRRGGEYVADVAKAVDMIGRPPVLVGHSMGGYVVQKYLEKRSVPAVVLLASVPPYGAIGASLQSVRRHPLAFLKTNLQMRLGPIVGTPDLARDVLFSDKTPAEHAYSYFPRLQDDTYLGYLDMLFLDLPRPRRIPRLPTLVLGAADDALFTPAEVRATARTYRAKGALFPAMGHEMMLEPGWRAVADTIIAWLRRVPGIC
jgi:pimeloyl-ACP methyl ester carboxylesterase